MGNNFKILYSHDTGVFSEYIHQNKYGLISNYYPFFMNASKLLDYDNFLDAFKNGLLDSIYLIKTGSMAYSGIVRAVDEESIIMDLPLKFYSGNNVIYTPVIIGRDEINQIKEIPVEGNAAVDIKNVGQISGEIEKAYSNRMIIDRNGEKFTVYYQDIIDIE